LLACSPKSLLSSGFFDTDTTLCLEMGMAQIPLQIAQCFVLNLCVPMKRTLFAIVIAVLISLMFAPHTGRGLVRFANYAHGPFFILPSRIDGKQLLLQTVIIALLFALIANIPWKKRR
jgi:hypothetical protein